MNITKKRRKQNEVERILIRKNINKKERRKTWNRFIKKNKQKKRDVERMKVTRDSKTYII